MPMGATCGIGNGNAPSSVDIYTKQAHTLMKQPAALTGLLPLPAATGLPASLLSSKPGGAANGASAAIRLRDAERLCAMAAASVASFCVLAAPLSGLGWSAASVAADTMMSGPGYLLHGPSWTVYPVVFGIIMQTGQWQSGR